MLADWRFPPMIQPSTLPIAPRGPARSGSMRISNSWCTRPWLRSVLVFDWGGERLPRALMDADSMEDAKNYCEGSDLAEICTGLHASSTCPPVAACCLAGAAVVLVSADACELTAATRWMSVALLIARQRMRRLREHPVAPSPTRHALRQLREGAAGSTRCPHAPRQLRRHHVCRPRPQA